MSLSVVWADELELALDKMIEVLLVLAVTLAAYRLFTNQNTAFVHLWFWRTIVAVGFALLLLAVITKAGSAGRAAVLGGGPNVFGRNMALLFIGATHLSETHSRGHYPFILLAACAALGVLLSGSRGALVAFLLAVLPLMILRRAKRQYIVGYLTVFAVVLLLITSTPVGDSARAMYEHRVRHLLLEKQYTSGRALLYTQALQFAAEHPIVGSGLNSFRAAYLLHPHNMFLEALCEGGLVALVLLILGLGFTAYALLSLKTYTAVLAASLILLFVHAQVSGDIYGYRGLFFFAVMILATSRVEDSLQNTRRAITVRGYTTSRARLIRRPRNFRNASPSRVPQLPTTPIISKTDENCLSSPILCHATYARRHTIIRNGPTDGGCWS